MNHGVPGNRAAVVRAAAERKGFDGRRVRRLIEQGLRDLYNKDEDRFWEVVTLMIPELGLDLSRRLPERKGVPRG